MYSSIFFSNYTCITPFFSSYTCITPIFFELYMYNSIFFVRYIPIHFYTFYIFLFLNLPFGKRLHFSSFHGWVLNWIFFQVPCLWNQNCNFGKPADSLLAVLVFLPAALLAHLELLSIIAVLVMIFGLILHTHHWLQDFVRRRARYGHSRSLRRIIKMWSNEPQCFKAILCQEITFQLILLHAFQTHPVNKIIKNNET